MIDLGQLQNEVNYYASQIEGGFVFSIDVDGEGEVTSVNIQPKNPYHDVAYTFVPDGEGNLVDASHPA